VLCHYVGSEKFAKIWFGALCHIGETLRRASRRRTHVRGLMSELFLRIHAKTLISTEHEAARGHNM
jgi:hypothetical protein